MHEIAIDKKGLTVCLSLRTILALKKKYGDKPWFSVPAAVARELEKVAHDTVFTADDEKILAKQIAENEAKREAARKHKATKRGCYNKKKGK